MLLIPANDHPITDLQTLKNEHMRQVTPDGPDMRMFCSCGYVSAPFADPHEALTFRCPIEHELRVSQWRREQWEKKQDLKRN